jgi:hypothetical protein
MRVFSTACNYVSITSVVSKWWPFSFIFNQFNREKYGGRGMTVMLLMAEKSPVKNEV